MTGDELRARLEELGMNHTRFAHCIGYTARSVRYWVNGNAPVPPIVALVADLLVERANYFGKKDT